MARLVGVDLDEKLLKPKDKQNFKATLDYFTAVENLGNAAMACTSLPEQTVDTAHDIFVLGSLLGLLRSGLFDTHLDSDVALTRVVAGGLGIFYLQHTTENKAFNVMWYVHIQRTVQSLLCTVANLQEMEKESGQTLDFYICLCGNQRIENLFSLVRTLVADRNCTDLELSSQVDHGALMAAIFTRHPEWRGKVKASGADRLRPSHYIGDTRVARISLPVVLRQAEGIATGILTQHRGLTEVSRTFDCLRADGFTALEPLGIPLLYNDDGDDGDDTDDEAEPALSTTPDFQGLDAFLEGGRIQYRGQDRHIMTVINTRLNGLIVRRSSDRLLRIAGFSRTGDAEEQVALPTPLKDMLWVGSPFAAMVNFRVKTRCKQLKSTIRLFSFQEANWAGQTLRDATHREMATSQGVITAQRCLSREWRA